MEKLGGKIRKSRTAISIALFRPGDPSWRPNEESSSSPAAGLPPTIRVGDCEKLQSARAVVMVKNYFFSLFFYARNPHTHDTRTHSDSGSCRRVAAVVVALVVGGWGTDGRHGGHRRTAKGVEWVCFGACEDIGELRSILSG